MNDLTAEQAAKMSRAQALEVLATAEGIDPRQQRLARLLLAGPDITFAEESSLRSYRPQLPPLAAAVRGALEQMKFDAIRAEQVARADMIELGGGLG